MATAIPKISLSSSRDIPFNRLVLSQSNVRRVGYAAVHYRLGTGGVPADRTGLRSDRTAVPGICRHSGDCRDRLAGSVLCGHAVSDGAVHAIF